MPELKMIWFIAAGTQGLLLSIGLWVRSRKAPAAPAFLAILVAVMSLELLTNFAVNIKYVQQANAFPFWVLGSYLLIPPALFLLACHAVGRKPPVKIISFLLFLPAFLEISVEAILYFGSSFHNYSIYLYQARGWFFFTEILPIFATLLVVGWWAVQLCKQPLKAYGWLPVALLLYYSLLSVLWLLEVVFQISMLGLLEMMLAAFLLGIAYLGFLRPVVFDKIRLSKANMPHSWSYDDKASLKRLDELFETGQVYRRSKLSVNELSKALSLPSRYITYLALHYHQSSVTSLVNKYRVEEVMRKIADPEQQHKTLLALAMEAGFNSKSTFNVVFKAHTGISPSQYAKTRGKLV